MFNEIVIRICVVLIFFLGHVKPISLFYQEAIRLCGRNVDRLYVLCKHIPEIQIQKPA